MRRKRPRLKRQSAAVRLNQRRINELQAERDLLASVVRYAPLAVSTLCSSSRTIVTWNLVCEQLFGIKEDDAKGKDLFTVLPEPLRRELQLIESGMNASNRKRVDHAFSLSGLDGRTRHYELDYGYINPDSNQMVFAMRDVTERKEFEQRMSEFYSMVSHEMRAPLTSIRAALGLIEGGVVENEGEAVELINVANQSADRLIRLINDLLDWKKIEAGKLELQLKNIDAGDVVAAAMQEVSGLAAGYNVRIKEKVDGGCAIFADRDKLTQVLTNFLSNALKFSARGGEVRIRVVLKEHASVRFTVEDDGPGIASEHIPKLFQKFEKLDGDERAGSGLGLAISKALVEQHGGTVGVQSVPKHGSSFWFELPLVANPSLSPGKC